MLPAVVDVQAHPLQSVLIVEESFTYLQHQHVSLVLRTVKNVLNLVALNVKVDTL